MKEKALFLLKELISRPSFSQEEGLTANIIFDFLNDFGHQVERAGNNVWVKNKHYRIGRPTILLNSHHDTVKPNAGYSRNPFEPVEEEGKLYGLGSNDAGASLVALLTTFLHYGNQPLAYNLIFAATAEEEISGQQGIASILHELGEIDFAIIGEPTQLQMAIAEKGLMVLDCEAKGRSGHAARDEGENAIYRALEAIDWFRHYKFKHESSMLGAIKMNVTMIEAGTQHNVVPDTCKFVVDVRSTDAYQNEEILEIIRSSVDIDVQARSTRLNPSSISEDHAIVQSGKRIGLNTYGSPTLSDQALLSCPSLKIGPGDSARSHTADEFVYLSEVEQGIETYIDLLAPLLNQS